MMMAIKNGSGVEMKVIFHFTMWRNQFINFGGKNQPYYSILNSCACFGNGSDDGSGFDGNGDGSEIDLA